MEDKDYLIDKFCEWFEGEFDNWTQASSNPSQWSHIFIVHKKISDRKFLTTSRYNYQTEPYRQQEVEVTQEGDTIVVKNPVCDMVFKLRKPDADDDYFQGSSVLGCTYKGKELTSKAKLYADQYHSWDEGYWQSSNGFFTFKKKL